MSLELAAQHLASRGRGPDTQLIHMAPQEVAGLHALAKAHGGSLTTNPDTGLPEAGFLSSILPMVIGGTLMAMTGGAAAPLIAGMSNAAVIGLGTGAVTGLATGSLSKGLMAGLGAFGGAGLAGGLMGAGAAGAGAGASALDAGMGAFPNTGTIGAAMPTTNLGAAAITPDIMGGTAGQVGAAYGYTPPIPGAIPPPVPAVGPTAQALTGGAPQVATATPMADRFSQLGQGFKNLGTEAGREAFMGTAATKTAEATGMGGLGGLAKYGMAAAAPIMFQEPKAAAKPDEEKPYEYSYSSGYNPTPDEGYTGAYTGERTHFDHRFTRKAAGGGLMDIQPVEAMSQQNQSQMRPAYAQGGVSDMAVNPYTGSETFAEGGDTTAKDPYNTMTGQSADMYNYLMGQGQRPAAAPRAIAPTPVPTLAAAALSGPAPITAPEARAGEAPLTMSYTFDPVTGGFRKLAPTEANYAAPATTGMGYYGDYGGDSGSAGVGPGPGTGEGGGMSNSGEGGGAAGEGGWARGGIASLAEGGQSHLGDYSDGGRLLRGPGNGTSDDIPASIGDKRPARLADGEFIIPSRIVSELGNGSTEAGARQLYAMMDRVQKARAKTTGKNKVAFDAKARNQLPA